MFYQILVFWIIKKNSFAVTFLHFFPFVYIEPDAANSGGRDIVDRILFKQNVCEVTETRIVSKQHNRFIFIILISYQFEQIHCIGMIHIFVKYNLLFGKIDCFGNSYSRLTGMLILLVPPSIITPFGYFGLESFPQAQPL